MNGSANRGGGGVKPISAATRSTAGGGSAAGGAGNAGGSHQVSCFARNWRVLRHCCCRYGFYPAFVAPIVTAACLLSLYSASGCDFLDLDVGFTPSNAAYNRSEASLGLFFYQRNDFEHSNKYRDRFHTGCVQYTDTFQRDFISQDRTWKVARIMALIAGISSVCCSIGVWLVCFVPIPVNIAWPGILLPLVMLSFIAEGSKFLIFDIALCSNAIWLPSGVDSRPQSAEGCGLGQSGIFGVTAAALFLVSLLMICLNTPEQRVLDPDYGLFFVTGNEHDLEAQRGHVHHHEDGIEVTDRVDDDFESHIGGHSKPPSDGDYNVYGDTDSEFDVYTTNPLTPTGNLLRNSHSDQRSAATSSMGTNPSQYACESSSSSAQKTTMTSLSLASTKEHDVAAAGSSEQQDDRPKQRVSESRVSKLEQMELNVSAGTDSMLQDLVSDLNTSLGAVDISAEELLPPGNSRGAAKE